MNEEEMPTLDNFFISQAVKPISTISDVDLNKDFYLYVGSVLCPHSQLGTTHFSEGCQVEKQGSERICHAIDLAKEGGQELADELGVPEVPGVPSLLRWKSKSREFENIATGRRMSPEYEHIFKEIESGKL